MQLVRASWTACWPSAGSGRRSLAHLGDTGGAAIEAFRGSPRVDVAILFPEGRVSAVQRRMMTTPTEPNVHAIAVRGTFDDCQALVKAMFNDHGFRDRVSLAGVNSINWARIAGQVTYYFVAQPRSARRIARVVRRADRQLRESSPATWQSAWACRSRSVIASNVTTSCRVPARRSMRCAR